MVKAEMVGHVESIDTTGSFDNSFVLTDEKLPDTKFVNHVKFIVSSKKTQLIDTIKVGDKVKVTFFVTGIEGESKKTGKPYQINKLMVGDIAVLESTSSNNEEQAENDDVASDIPF